MPKTVGMDRLSTGNIFMLEFIVDTLKLELVGKQDYKIMAMPACIAFSFFNFDPIYICEDTAAPKHVKCVGGCSGCGGTKLGQSCLFSMNPRLVFKSVKKFNINVEVFKRMPAYTVPEKFEIGKVVIPIQDLFKQVLQDLVLTAATTHSKTMKQVHRIKNSGGEETGQLSLYIRLSCFGKVIITRFQMDLSKEAIEYRSTEGSDMYKYNKTGQEEDVYCSPPCSNACCAGVKTKPPCQGIGMVEAKNTKSNPKLLGRKKSTK